MKTLKIFLVLLLLLYPSLQSADSVAYAGVRLAKTGIQYILNFELFEVDGVDFRVDAADGGSDCIIRKDQAADATAVNDFVDEGNSYSLTITPAEMQAKQVFVHVIDQSGTKVWLDKAFLIETYGSPTAEHAFDLDLGTQTVDIGLISGDDNAANNLETAADNYSATRGLTGTAVPAAVADAAGGLIISDGGGLDADGQFDGIVTNAQGTDVATDVAAMIDGSNRVDVGSWIGTAVTLGSGAPDVNIASSDNIDLTATQKTSVNTEVDNALDTVLPGSPTTGSINDILDIQEEGVVTGAAAAGTLSTTEMTTDLTVTVNDQFNGRIITFRKDTTTAALRGQQTDITDTVTTNGKLTFTAITTAPSAGDIFEIN